MDTDNKDWFYRSKEFQNYFKNGTRSLLIKADPPHFTILAASDAFLSVVEKQRNELLNRGLFDVFPGNTADPSEQREAFQSLQKTIAEKKTNERPLFKYEIYKANTGKWQTEYWIRSHEPVFDDRGEVAYLINTTTNVTQKIVTEQTLQEAADLKAFLQREQELNEEQATTLEELRAVNEELHDSQERLFTLNNELEGRVESRTREIKNNESRFRSLVEQIPAAINVFLTEKLIVDLPNSRMLELWGRTLAEVNGKPLDVAMPELRGQPFMQKLRDVIFTGVAYASTEEKALIQRHGQLEECYFDIIYQPIINEDGSITSCLQIASEVTEAVAARRRIQALNEELAATNEELAAANEELSSANEELLAAQNELLASNKQLSESEERFRTMSESTNVFIGVSDEAGNAIYFNGIWSQVTGRDNEALLAFGWADLVHPEDKELTLRNYKEAVENKTAFTNEFRLLTKEGTYIWLFVQGIPRIHSDGSFVGHINSAFNITEQKRDEQRKNDFIGMVSHELKTPLTSLSGYLQLLRQKANTADAVTLTMVDKANKQIGKMTTMINGFLNVSRLESGKIQINKQRFDMADLVKESEEETRSLYNSHEFIFHPVEKTMVNADRDKIGQVVNNLISNAVKYSPANTAIHIACITAEGMAQVSIKDEGIGIKDEDKDKLFDRYYRVNNDNSTSVSGFGIGLYLCAEIIQRHDGTIRVESKIGKGSTFSFTLPVEKG